ncbi:MAG TPA: hypothetical protein PJ991_05795 [Kiritimatiellia bacterium]|nr:hypothetical protein [Kiritimatiellia bacterium]
MNVNLNNLMKTWMPKEYTALDIRAGVWQRIERAEPAGWRVAMESLFALMTRPALATGLVAFAIMAGIAVGTITSETAQTQAYLNSVAVYRMLP